MKTLIIGLLLSTLSFSSFAKGDKGNGGEIIYCPNANQQSMLLDYYEGHEIPMPNVDFTQAELLGQDPSTYSFIVSETLRTWSLIDPIFSAIIATTANQLVREIQLYEEGLQYNTAVVFFTDKLPTDVDGDDALVSPPEGCTKEQLAVRTTREVPNLPKFMVSTKYWAALNGFHRAGLILHEAIYKYYSDVLKHTDSMVSRSLNRMISSDNFKDMNIIDYFIMLDDHKLTSQTNYFVSDSENKYNIRNKRYTSRIDGTANYRAGFAPNSKGLLLTMNEQGEIVDVIYDGLQRATMRSIGPIPKEVLFKVDNELIEKKRGDLIDLEHGKRENRKFKFKLNVKRSYDLEMEIHTDHADIDKSIFHVGMSIFITGKKKVDLLIGYDFNSVGESNGEITITELSEEEQQELGYRYKVIVKKRI